MIKNFDYISTNTDEVIKSFDKQIKQMSTPLHQQPTNNIIQGT